MKVARRLGTLLVVSAGVLFSVVFLTAQQPATKPAGPAPASSYAPPRAVVPDKEVLKTIDERKDRLAQALTELRRLGVRDPALADIEIYHKAASWIVRHGEFYHKDAGEWTIEALDRGLLRASQQLRGETPWLYLPGYPVVRAYRSAVDGSVQPYAVTYPAEYGGDKDKKWHIEVELHGRKASLTEVSFLHQHNGKKPAAKDLDYIHIEIYGRGNNAYRWAGETDVQEVLQNFLLVEQQRGRGQLIDLRRTVLRGFSMGGAGTWHLGLHFPSEWCVIGPGAGFTTTHGYLKNIPDQLPPEQEACLRIYDAVDYAENAFNVPVVAYGGSDDPQLAAAQNIKACLEPLHIPMTLLVAPGLGHQFPTEWKKKAAEAYSKHIAQGRPEYPRQVRFVTYTLKYPRCYWVEIQGLERHYQRASVDAERTDDGFKVQTSNVRVLHLALWPGASRQAVVVDIDGQRLEVQPGFPTPSLPSLHLHLERRGGQWSALLPERFSVETLRSPQKVSTLTGPIDDAFTTSFLCVRGSGTAWHEATDRHAHANLERFRDEWSKYLRGELDVKDDVEVTPEDIASRNLILFGDPGSNSLIAQALPGLPFRWTRDTITWAGKDYAAAEHVPVLVYPSPLSALRYIVLNSGHTFHAADFQGTNALLYPRLGDHALLRLGGDKKDPLNVEVLRAGLFDDFWKMSEK
jgi:predicted esterase